MTELPPLPEPFMELHREISPAVYNAWQAQMRAYAAEAVRVALGEPVAWLARNRAGHLFIINGNGPHDVFGGFPVYQVKDHA